MFKMVKGRLVFLPGRGKPFSFVAVQDLVEMICRCTYKSAEEAQRIQTYFPCHPEPVLYEEIMHSMAKAQQIRRTATISLFPAVMWLVAGLGQLLSRMGFEKAVALTPDKVREAIQVGWVCSPQKTIDEFRMQYDYDLDRAIQCATDDYQKRGWL